MLMNVALASHTSDSGSTPNHMMIIFPCNVLSLEGVGPKSNAS